MQTSTIKIRTLGKNVSRYSKLALMQLSAVSLLASCGFQTYQSRPIEPTATAQRYLAHTPDSIEFQQYLAATDYPQNQLPIQQWGLRELTLSALFFHPQLNVARAQWRAATAGEITAAQRLLPGISGNLENHSDHAGGISPWTYGLGIDIPIETAGKRQARIDRAINLSEAARIDIAQNAWDVRSRLALSLIEYRYASEQLQILRREVALRQQIVDMLDKRLQAGMVSTVETSNFRLLLQRAQQSMLAEEGRIPELRAAVASNSGLPLTTFNQLPLLEMPLLTLVEAPGALPQPEAANDMQQAAMLNRLDLRAALARYAAAEARLKLEIARQYPDVLLSPGYSYDQGDRIWSLGFSTLLTFLHGNRGLIAEATSLREVEAAQFEALQAQVIGDISQVQQRYWGALNELRQARLLQQSQQARTLQNERQFEAGFTDRLEYTTTRLESLLAEQNVLNVAYKVQKASASLEDLMQRPLQDLGSMPTDLDQAVSR